MKNWKTSLAGLFAGLPLLLHMMGISIGHVGNGDVLTAISAVAVTVLGVLSKDKNVTGGTVANNSSTSAQNSANAGQAVAK